MTQPLSRRRFLTASASVAAGITILPSRARAAEWQARQVHAQPADSHLQRYLGDLWKAVKEESAGRLDVTVYPSSMGIADAGPVVLKKVMTGEIEFHVLMGGVFGQQVPVMDVQSVPFAFTSSEQVMRIMDGALGDYLHTEMRAKGVYGFPFGLMENGFRQMVSIRKPVRTVEDLAGYRMRVPAGRVFSDLFASLGATPVTVNIDKLYASLKDGSVDGQENPLVVTEENHLYEVSTYVSMTNHMWSGFNMYGNLNFWNTLPGDIQTIVQRNVRKFVAAQRLGVRALNRELETRLAGRGMTFNTVDTQDFRRRLSGGFYQRWKAELGSKAWNLLEAGVGKLA